MSTNIWLVVAWLTWWHSVCDGQSTTSTTTKLHVHSGIMQVANVIINQTEPGVFSVSGGLSMPNHTIDSPNLLSHRQFIVLGPNPPYLPIQDLLDALGNRILLSGAEIMIQLLDGDYWDLYPLRFLEALQAMTGRRLTIQGNLLNPAAVKLHLNPWLGPGYFLLVFDGAASSGITIGGFSLYDDSYISNAIPGWGTGIAVANHAQISIHAPIIIRNFQYGMWIQAGASVQVLTDSPQIQASPFTVAMIKCVYGVWTSLGTHIHLQRMWVLSELAPFTQSPYVFRYGIQALGRCTIDVSGSEFWGTDYVYSCLSPDYGSSINAPTTVYDPSSVVNDIGACAISTDTDT